MSILPDLINALDNGIRDDLQHFGQSLFAGVVWSAIVVMIGVALEGPEILHELWPRRFAFFATGSVRRIRGVKRWLTLIGFAGWALVVVGVAGEGIFEMLQNRAEGQLQTFNDILLTDAQRNAGSARESAIDAGNIVNQLKVDLATTTSQLEDAERRLGEEQRKTAKEQESAAKMQMQLAQQFERSTIPRFVNFSGGDSQTRPLRDSLLADIKKRAGTSALIQVIPDVEAQRLADSIASGLVGCGWKVQFTNPAFTGIPYDWMEAGVLLITPEVAPSATQSRIDDTATSPLISDLGHGAAELAKLFEIDLGSFGQWSPPVLYEPDFRRRGPDGKIFDFGLPNQNAKWPDDTVLILVGPKPMQYPTAAQSLPQKKQTPAKSKPNTPR